MMIDTILDVGILIALLVGLVLVHEVGHFIAARRAGVTVHEFGVGFPPRAMVLYRGRETTYSLNWLPIGGFVRLEGEEGASWDPRAFIDQRLTTRLRILSAGVVVNFAVAWLIFSFIAASGDPVDDVRVGPVEPGSPAAAAGLTGSTRHFIGPSSTAVYDRSGDIIVAIDGVTFPSWDRIDGGSRFDAPLAYLDARAGQTVALTVLHSDGSESIVSAALRQEGTRLGVVMLAAPYAEQRHGVVESLVIGFERTVEASTLILRSVGDLIAGIFTGAGTAERDIVGPVGLVSIIGDVREAPPVSMLLLIGLLSANLAVINILPFPPLDGGRIVMAVAQAISRDRISLRVERAVYLAGFVALMSLMAWVTIGDIGESLA